MKQNNSTHQDALISVLVLNFNGLIYLKQSIPALLALNYPQLEVVVFDNGSTDGSLEYLTTFSRKLSVIANPENIGYSCGKNAAVKHAKGKYVLMLDNDIVVHDTSILQQLIHSYSHSTGFIQVPLLNTGANSTRYYGVYYTWYGVHFHLKSTTIEKVLALSKTIYEIPGATGGCLFFRRTLWAELGGFDESQPFNLDDIDIGPRASLLGYHNYLHLSTYFTHLGIGHVDTTIAFASRFKWQVSGHARSMLKNYNVWNLMVRFPIFWLFMWVKAVRYSIKHRSLFVLQKFGEGCFHFATHLLDTLRIRRHLQHNRTVKKDHFLQLQPPNFDCNE